MIWLLYLIFLLSGAAALIFETLWFRLAGLTFGNSIWATSLVLSSFMCGLAVGNGLAGKFGHRLRRPIRFYAGLELLIGMMGLGLVLLFPMLNELLAPLFRPFVDRPWILNPIRLGIGFFLLLCPAAAMGATLPIMVKGLCDQQAPFGRSLGMLYGCNTLGAVAGALVGEMALIDWFGVRGTAISAALINLTAAVAALGVSYRLVLARSLDGHGRSNAEPSLAHRSNSLSHDSPATVTKRRGLGVVSKQLLAAAFLCGGILLALEVVWFRVILVLSRGTSLTFALMLACVLAGIGLGGIVTSWWLKWRPATRMMPAVALAGSALVVGTYAAFAIGASGEQALGPSAHTSDMVSRSIRLMLPVCFVSGVLFTLIGQALYQQIGGETRSAGYLTLANTLGAMIGALLGGFVLLPRLGMEMSLFCLALMYGVVAVLTLPRPLKALRHIEAGALCALVLIFVLTAGFFPFGLMRNHIFALTISQYTADGSYLKDIREGLNETIFYLQNDRFQRPYYHRLVTNSHTMSGTEVYAKRYMKQYVYLPVALHRGLKRALLISYGVGTTAKALTDTATLEHIDVVDISRDILEMNRIVFPDEDSFPLNDPRVRVFIEDARFFLQTSASKYDLITGEPPPPKNAGVGNLYSREYFQLIYDRLAPGGMVTYWLPVHQLNETEQRAIVRAFCEVFEESSLWLGAGLDWMLFGVRDAQVKVSQEQFTRQWRDPVVGPELRALGFEVPEQMSACFVADGPWLRALTKDTPPLVDNYPHRLSPDAVTSRESKYYDMLAPEPAKQRFMQSAHISRLWPDTIRDSSLAFFQYRRLIHDVIHLRRDRSSLADLRYLHTLLTESSLRTLVLWHLGTDDVEQQILAMVSGQTLAGAQIQKKLGDRAMADRNYPAAAEYYRKAQQANPRNGIFIDKQIYALCLAGRKEDARSLIKRHSTRSRSPGFWQFLQEKFTVDPPYAKGDRGDSNPRPPGPQPGALTD